MNIRLKDIKNDSCEIYNIASNKIKITFLAFLAITLFAEYMYILDRYIIIYCYIIAHMRVNFKLNVIKKQYERIIGYCDELMLNTLLEDGLYKSNRLNKIKNKSKKLNDVFGTKIVHIVIYALSTCILYEYIITVYDPSKITSFWYLLCGTDLYINARIYESICHKYNLIEKKCQELLNN